jgi:ADP-dependent NAD(P)H-hydrate dehydratase / NAD(P)H-hydrate epimerase
VGNPTTGKMFFQTDPAAGAVVPLGFYVWQNSSGTSEIGYFDPAGLMTAISPTLTPAGQQMSQMAAKLARGTT